PLSELNTKAVSASKERSSGVSLADLKALAAADEDFENSRIKLGLQSLVSKGTLVQTKGIGASGFKLNQAATGESKPKAKKTGASSIRKLVNGKYRPKKQKNKCSPKKKKKKKKKKMRTPKAAAGMKLVKSSPRNGKMTKKKKKKKNPARSRAPAPEPAKSAPAPKKGSKKAVTKAQKKDGKKRITTSARPSRPERFRRLCACCCRGSWPSTPCPKAPRPSPSTPAPSKCT
uniref:H15 domain-containing protein n=1 Tax=Sus scrofa TaxID=9823 RepID=A0A8D0X342_PIG